jgi:hypothetical protein
MTLVWRPGFQFDADASTYIEAVEAADTQALETGVRYAINDFVIGCKQDGIWNAIKASCILAGARTLDGCLVPLVGAAPTSYNFVAGDYNRETGLVGDASTKYLDSNRAANAEPTGDYHMSVYLPGPGTYGRVIGAYSGGGSADDFLSYGSAFLRNRSKDLAEPAGAFAPGFQATSRDSLNSFIYRNNGINVPGSTVTAANPGGRNMLVFAQNDNGTAKYFSNASLSFYSIGESLDLALLDARVTTLINAIAAAIP